MAGPPGRSLRARWRGLVADRCAAGGRMLAAACSLAGGRKPSTARAVVLNCYGGGGVWPQAKNCGYLLPSRKVKIAHMAHKALWLES